MKWTIVPDERRFKEPTYDKELVDKLIAGKTAQIEDGGLGTYYRVAREKGYSLRSRKEGGITIIWFVEKEEKEVK